MPYKLIEIESSNEYKSFSNMYLLDLEAKHIAKLNDQNRVLFTASLVVKYNWIILGSHRYASTLDKEKERILKMTKSEERAIKIVLTTDGLVWADNTHWTIAYILKYGMTTKLKDVPFYIVDLRYDNTNIVDVNNSIIKNESNIVKTIKEAQDIENRIQKGWRKDVDNWSIRDLFDNLYK